MTVAALVLVFLCCAPVYADDPGACGESLTWYWEDDDHSILRISGTGAMYDYKWEPPEWGGDFSTVVIGEGVTSIGRFAFRNCTFLVNVTLPSTLTFISESAFEGCTALTAMTLPDSLTDIGPYAFKGCTGLSDITLSADTASIGESAFKGCTALTAIDLPDTVSTIEKYAFADCSALASVKLPSGLTAISDGLFEKCASLLNVIIPGSVSEIREIAFEGCNSLLSMTIPEGVTVIPYGAFKNCTALSSVAIPASVKEIGECSFLGCSGLTDVTYAGTQEQWSEIRIENDNDCLTMAIIHYGPSEPSGILILPADLTAIESQAFAGLTDVDAISIPATVKSIADDAFEGSDIVIIAPAGSYAATWAQEHGFIVNP